MLKVVAYVQHLTEKHKYFGKKQKYTQNQKKLISEHKLKHNNYFDKTMHFEGKFNRLVCFDSKHFHAAEVCHKERLILISFLGGFGFLVPFWPTFSEGVIFKNCFEVYS